jgi:3-deoxy-D-manno-octulosonic acid kinase
VSVIEGWIAGPEVHLIPVPGGAMLYDSSRVPNAERGWLDEAWWARRGTLTVPSEGRGNAHFIDADGRQFVLRHYRRGGIAARLSPDRYLWRGEERTRSFREWQLLYQLLRQRLPVPTPIAASYRRDGRTYSATLLIDRIPDAQSVHAHLREAPLPIHLWVAIGRCLRRFHERGVFHADLNARNILVDSAERVWVIDFDRSSIRTPGWWCDANLARLHRSLRKLLVDLPEERFATADWHCLLDGYFSGQVE